jgi:hypothetical protein
MFPRSVPLSQAGSPYQLRSLCLCTRWRLGAAGGPERVRVLTGAGGAESVDYSSRESSSSLTHVEREGLDDRCRFGEDPLERFLRRLDDDHQGPGPFAP